MKDVQLVKLDPAIEASLVDDPAYMAAMVEDNWAQVADLVHQLVGRTLTATPVSVRARINCAKRRLDLR